MTVYIYGLYDPRGIQELRYIGKTINPKMRFSGHLNEQKNTYKNNWIRSLRAELLNPVMKILETIENSDNIDWQDRERWWIMQARSIGVRLTNLESGGATGKFHAPETRSKIGKAKIGTKPIYTEDGRRRHLAANSGRIRTEATKQKQREARMAQVFSPEALARQKAAMKGKAPSPECIAACIAWRKRMKDAKMHRASEPA